MTDFQLKYDDGVEDLPLVPGTDKPEGFDVRKLLANTGHVTFDPGLFAPGAASFTSTDRVVEPTAVVPVAVTVTSLPSALPSSPLISRDRVMKPLSPKLMGPAGPA